KAQAADPAGRIPVGPIGIGPVGPLKGGEDRYHQEQTQETGGAHGDLRVRAESAAAWCPNDTMLSRADEVSPCAVGSQLFPVPAGQRGRRGILTRLYRLLGRGIPIVEGLELTEARAGNYNLIVFPSRWPAKRRS